MTTMVCFRAAGAAYCLPLQAARSVRTAADVIPLPDTAADVAGIIPGDPPLTVISPLNASGRHILVIEAQGQAFGLLVDRVTGLRRVDAADIRPAPKGQGRHRLVSGTIDADDGIVFVADPTALAGRL
jgi:chemotaxis signal transduction protein